MGTGKTNILNSINWCLYNEEPFLSKNSQNLMRLNLNTIEEAGYTGKIEKVSVEIWAEHNKNVISFMREENFSIYIFTEKDRKREFKRNCESKGQNFEVITKDNSGNDILIKSDEAENYVERLLPRGIKDYFLFDGERLDNYFKTASGQKIYKEIFQMAQVHVLDRVENNLSSLLTEYKRDAGKQNPQIEATRRAIEAKESSKKNHINDLTQTELQIKTAKEQIEDLDRKLRGIPDIAVLEKDRDILRKQKSSKNQLLDQKLKTKQDIIFEAFRNYMMFDSFTNF